jgi:hypothetical protein
MGLFCYNTNTKIPSAPNGRCADMISQNQMNEWSKRRRRNIFILALFCLIVVISLPLYYFLQVVPTCSDAKQNGDETGVDCGGSCTTLCQSQSLPLIAKGDPRLLQIASSTYEAVAYIQNPNTNGQIAKAVYTFTFYEASSTLPVKTITGSAFVPKNTDFAVFVGPFDSGDKALARVTFAWDPATLDWQKNTDNVPVINISGKEVINASSTPRINAGVSSQLATPINNLYLVALVFDASGTIMAASKTYIETLDPGTTEPAVFSWPNPFIFTSALVRILPVVLPDASYIQ